jgi:hypothetical protein
MDFWPLRAPPQIVGDSVTENVTTSLVSIAIPVRADGTPAHFILISWENAQTLRLRQGATSSYMNLPHEQQPFLVCVAHKETILVKFHLGSGKVHFTPVEEK